MSNSLNVEEAKAYLKKDENGVNLYDHLSDVLLKILIEKPKNSLDAFEHISEAVKQARLKVEGSSRAGDNQQNPMESNAIEQQEAWCAAATDLLKALPEEDAPGPVSGVADLLDEANMFEWAGIGFSKGETYRLSAALYNLAAKTQSSSLRLWGKILGKSLDYYIAEGEIEEVYEPEDPSTSEGKDGANQKTYWCMKDDGHYQWVQLPNVTQAQILSAREIRRFVGEDLEAKISGHPPFPGLEKHFIRAQIARISSSTIICPSGFFSLNEDGEVIMEEESEGKTASELSDISNWVHLTKELNATYGRCTAMPPKTNEEGEEESWENEVIIDPLRALSEDQENVWKAYTVPNSSNASPNNVGEVAVVKSLVWPGAATVGLGKKFLNIYVGHALKYSESPFQRVLPGPLQTGHGVAPAEPAEDDENQQGVVSFTALKEQEDVIEDPTPPVEDEAEV